MFVLAAVARGSIFIGWLKDRARQIALLLGCDEAAEHLDSHAEAKQ